MKESKFNKYSKYILILFFLLLGLSLIPLVGSLIENGIYKPLFTAKGFNLFFEEYKASISILGAAIIVFTIWLTLKRMEQTEIRLKQTDKQIDVITDNIRFNNFYKHREEFVREFSKKPLFIKLSEYSKIPIEYVLLDMYQFYFYNSYKEFSPTINSESFKLISNYYEKLNSSNLKNYTSNFSDIDIEEVSDVANSFPEHHIVIARYVGGSLSMDKMTAIHSKTMGEEEFDKFLLLCKIYYTYQIIVEVISSANLPTKNYNISIFTLSFWNYLEKHNFQDCLFLFK